MAANTRGTSNRSSEETHGTSSVGVRRGRLVVRMGAKKGAALGQGRLPSGKNTTFAGGGFSRLQKFISADLLCEPFPTRDRTYVCWASGCTTRGDALPF